MEELLKEALVPEEQQPYELPQNWVWVKLENVHDIITGSTPSKKVPQYYGGSFPIIKPGDLDQGDSVILASEYLSEEGKAKSRIIPKNSTLVCCIGSIGKAGFTLVDCTTNQQINSLVGIKNTVVPKYTYYFSLSESFRQALISRSSSTTISIINKFKMGQIPFPLPAYSEQRKISDKIDSLFTKIDEAKRLIDEAKESFELRRAAILDKAFRGELTNGWRDTNINIESPQMYNEESRIVSSSIPSTWSRCRLEDVILSFKYGTSEKSDYNYSGKPVLRIPNIGDSSLLLDDLKFLPDNSESNVVADGDILIIRSNGSRDLVGKCALVTKKEENFAFASYLIRLRPSERIIPEFLLWLLRSEGIKSQFFSYAKSSTGINNINIKELSNTIIPVPPKEEQQRLLNVINELLNNEDHIIKIINSKNLSDLKESILQKAFRGELGTNNATEESAIELLKETLNSQKK
ncbi:restriction endonuclease subunit S [Paenibacillus durus]|nr:restriction endonuclease subunit S [Paenibacillus durus]